MSSGNPFRTSQAFSQPPSSFSAPQTSSIPYNTNDPETRAKGREYVFEEAAPLPPIKTKKHVRIESSTTFIPPHPETDYSPETPQNPSAQVLGQSPYGMFPPASQAVDGLSIDTSASSSNVGRGGMYEMATVEAQPSGPRFPSSGPQTTFSVTGAPANPFSRTLASLEQTEGGSEDNRSKAERTTAGNNNKALDVEGFKNLLMTGKPTSRPSTQQPQSSVAPTTFNSSQFESSSSTDTSSISRHSLFEPPQELHTESPRTSYDDMADSSEDEQMGLVSEVKKGQKKPPPVPKSRHGKSVAPRQPQVVSFDSFSATEPTSSPITRPRDNSDLSSKPLPATPKLTSPSQHITTQDISRPPPSSPASKMSEPLSGTESQAPSKRAPPPVPLARRQSQLRSSENNRSRSNSSLTVSSVHSIEPLPSPVPSVADSTIGAKSPPPPPPSRRGARLANITTSSANSSSTELPQRAPSVRREAPTSQPATTLSRRSTIDSDSSEPASPVRSIHRVPSGASTSRSRAVSNESASASMPPPPPPPPRRRQSNRSSLDQQRPQIAHSPPDSRRSSGDFRRSSLEHKRRTSVASESSLRREYAPAPTSATTHVPPANRRDKDEEALYSPNEEAEDKLGRAGTESSAKETSVKTDIGDVGDDKDAGKGEPRSDSNNILDDMEKFQREIEELRLRYTQSK